MHNDSLLFYPPDSTLAKAFYFSNRPNSDINLIDSFFIVLESIPLKAPITLKCSATVSSLKRISLYGHKPTIFEACYLFKPNMLIYPEEGCSIPVSIDIVVVFPAPFYPSNANIYPFYISKDIWSTAVISSNFFAKLVINIYSLDA